MCAQKKNYGADSVKTSVPIRKGRRCLIKYHLTGCLREVIGFLEKMAALDRDRFVFVRKMETLQDNAVKNWKTKESYGPRQIRRALAQAEELGIAIFDIKDRQGDKPGYVVAEHDKIAFSWIRGRRCTLTVQHDKSLRQPAKPKHQKRAKTAPPTYPGLLPDHSGSPPETAKLTSRLTSFLDSVTSSEPKLTSRLTSSEPLGDITVDIIAEQKPDTNSDTCQKCNGSSEFGFDDASLCSLSLASKESLSYPAEAPTPALSLSNQNQHQNQNIGQGKANPEHTVPELYELLKSPEPPWFYFQNKFITEREYEELVELVEKDYAEHEEFYKPVDILSAQPSPVASEPEQGEADGPEFDARMALERYAERYVAKNA